MDTLSLCQLDKKQEHFVRLLQDPLRSEDNIATIARDAGLTAASVMALFTSSSFAQNQALVMNHISEALPEIARDIVDKSSDALVMCPECLGEGVLNGIKGNCPRCYGKGEIFRASDLDRQKLTLEIAGILKKGPSTQVNVNQQVGIMQPGNFFSRFVASSDKDAYDVGVIEAEKVED